MNKIFAKLCLAFLLVAASPLRGQIASFNDIATWAGSGANQSVLVVQWNDGKAPAALAWGFRWDGGASPVVSDMVQGVLHSNVGLFARGDSSTGYGAAYYGFGYSSNLGASFAVSGAQDQNGSPTAVAFAQGFSDMNVDPAATESPWTSLSAGPTTSADRYQEGWNDNGYWELFSATGTSYPSIWTSSLLGSNEPLVNNGWFAFSITDSSFNSNIPGPAVGAFPEPSALPMVILAGVILYYARKRLHSC